MATSSFMTTVAANLQYTLPGIYAIQTSYNLAPKQYEIDFKRRDTVRSQEITVQGKMLGVAQLTGEGEASYLSSFSTNGQKIFKMLKYTLATSVSQELIEDNLYPETAPRLAQSFKASMLERMNIEAAYVYAQGRNPNFPGWDGKPLYSSSHPVEGGFVSNTLSAAMPLHEVALTQLVYRIQTFRDPAGLLIGGSKAVGLTLGPGIAPQGYILMESYFRPGTGSFENNPVRGLGYIDGNMHINYYIPPTFYALRTNNPGLWYWHRKGFKIAQDANIMTNSILLSANIRNAFGFDDCRCSASGESPSEGI